MREERPDLKDMIGNFGTDRRDDVRGKFLVHANTQFVEFYHAPSSEVFNRLEDCERLQNVLHNSYLRDIAKICTPCSTSQSNLQ